MKNLLVALMLAASSAFADTIPAVKSGDEVIINDARYILIGESDYESLRTKIEYLTQKFAAAHSNEAGRVAFHGRRGHTTITNDTITVEYADGYKRTETIKSNAVKPNRPITSKAAQKAKSEFQKRRDEIMRKRREAATNHTEIVITKEVK